MRDIALITDFVLFCCKVRDTLLDFVLEEFQVANHGRQRIVPRLEIRGVDRSVVQRGTGLVEHGRDALLHLLVSWGWWRDGHLCENVICLSNIKHVTMQIRVPPA